MKEFYLNLDHCKVHCCLWLPEGQPKAVVQIIHGISEYIERYAPLADYLTSCGFAVVGEDHPGHGKSVGTDDQFGYLTGGWMSAVKTIHLLHNEVCRDYPDTPYIMLGHSMGSFLLRTYLFTYHSNLNGAILSGTGWQPDSILPAGILLCKEEAKRLGERSSSDLIQKLIFGAYNKTFAPNRTPYDWVSSDETVVDAYASDPFCTWLPTIQLCSEMMLGIQMIQKRSNLSRMQKELPVFFLSGQLDPVGNMGNGVLKCVQAFKDAGMTDVIVELYPNMRHECHNEINKEKVYQDVADWISSKIDC